LTINKTTGETSVVKVWKNNSRFPPNAVREISALNALNHPNIVKIKGINIETDISLFLETAEYNLYEWMNEQNPFIPKNVEEEIYNSDTLRKLIYQIILGMDYIHRNKIYHRDLKPQNILVRKDKSIAIADFGLSRSDPFEYICMSKEAYTLWYRPPEILYIDFLEAKNSKAKYRLEQEILSSNKTSLLEKTEEEIKNISLNIKDAREDYLGTSKSVIKCPRYGASADVWSVGMVILDILLSGSSNEYLLRGKETIDQYYRLLFRNPEKLGMDRYKYFAEDKSYLISPDLWDLLIGLTKINPEDRFSLSQALRHEYFKNIFDEKDIVPIHIINPNDDIIGCIMGNSITPNILKISFERLIDMKKKYKLDINSLTLCFQLIKCYIGRRRLDKKYLQLYACAALMLACNYYEIYSPRYEDMVEASFTVEELSQAIKDIFLVVGAQLHLDTSWSMILEQREIKLEDYRDFDNKLMEDIVSNAEVDLVSISLNIIVEYSWKIYFKRNRSS